MDKGLISYLLRLNEKGMIMDPPQFYGAKFALPPGMLLDSGYVIGGGSWPVWMTIKGKEFLKKFLDVHSKI